MSESLTAHDYESIVFGVLRENPVNVTDGIVARLITVAIITAQARKDLGMNPQGGTE